MAGQMFGYLPEHAVHSLTPLPTFPDSVSSSLEVAEAWIKQHALSGQRRSIEWMWALTTGWLQTVTSLRTNLTMYFWNDSGGWRFHPGCDLLDFLGLVGKFENTVCSDLNEASY